MTENENLFDKEHVSKTAVFIKGIGRRCEICQKHIFGRKDKTTCSNRCRKKKYRINTKQQNNNSIQARISITKYKDIKPYRVVSLYLKKNLIEKVMITEESKELWQFLDKIQRFRDLSIPLNAKSTSILPQVDIEQTVKEVCVSIPQLET